MKLISLKNIGRIVIVIGVIYLIDFGIDFGIRQNKNLKQSYLQEGTINAEIVVHGPCEPLWTIDPSILELKTGKSVYNLAQAHTNFADNYLTLYHYLKHNRPPELVMLYVTPESFDERFNQFHPYHFTTFNDSITDQVVSEMNPEFSKWRSYPVIRYTYFNEFTIFPAIQGFKHYFQRKEFPHFKNGYIPPLTMYWSNNYELFEKLYPKGMNYEWSLTSEKYFVKILNLCKQQNIQVILFESPVLDQAKPLQYNRENILNQINHIAQAYNVPFWQMGDHALSQSQENFFSSLCLKYEKGQQFSVELGERLREHLD